jgi:hypothetical protein
MRSPLTPTCEFGEDELAKGSVPPPSYEDLKVGALGSFAFSARRYAQSPSVATCDAAVICGDSSSQRGAGNEVCATDRMLELGRLRGCRDYQASEAKYKSCLAANPATPQNCEGLRLAMEADERKYKSRSTIGKRDRVEPLRCVSAAADRPRFTLLAVGI